MLQMTKIVCFCDIRSRLGMEVNPGKKEGPGCVWPGKNGGQAPGGRRHREGKHKKAGHARACRLVVSARRTIQSRPTNCSIELLHTTSCANPKLIVMPAPLRPLTIHTPGSASTTNSVLPANFG